MTECCGSEKPYLWVARFHSEGNEVCLGPDVTWAESEKDALVKATMKICDAYEIEDGTTPEVVVRPF
jgi:hypothetical protein